MTSYKMKKVSNVTFQVGKVKTTVPLLIAGKITAIKINKAFDKLHNKHEGYLYSYDPIITDEIIPAYCKTEKKEVTVHTVYGGFDDPIKDEKGHTVITISAGACKCGKGKLWLTKSKHVHSELVIETYRCFSCGNAFDEPID